MIDLFNKKKLKELEDEKNYYERVCEAKNKTINNLQLDKSELNKNMNNLINENKKLIDWIYKILDNFGQISNSEINYIRIPYTKSMTHKAYTDTKTICIRVPELILYKEERMK